MMKKAAEEQRACGAGIFARMAEVASIGFFVL
jgi:hypothetical protein